MRAVSIPAAVDGALTRLRLGGELLTLYVLLPVALLVFDLPPVWYIPGLIAGAAACLWILHRDPTFDQRRLYEGSVTARQALIVVGRFVLAATAVVALVAVAMPQELFSLPREDPTLWRLIMVSYPIFSVIPQGIIYRIFLFHRYRPIIGDGPPAVLIAAALFALAHIVMLNWLALALTLIGGLFFASTYRATRSNAVASFEHALYGLLMFTVGLASFFIGGGITR